MERTLENILEWTLGVILEPELEPTQGLEPTLERTLEMKGEDVVFWRQINCAGVHTEYIAPMSSC